MGILPPKRQFTAEGAQLERVYCAPSALWSFRRTTSDPIARWGNWFLSSRNKSSSWELFCRWIQGCWTSKLMWPWMLTQPMNSSSFQMTWGMYSVGTSDRECKHVLRCSATHFVSWAPLASFLAAVTGRQRGTKQRMGPGSLRRICSPMRRDPTVYRAWILDLKSETKKLLFGQHWAWTSFG